MDDCESFAAHEMVDAPVACVVLGSSTDDDLRDHIDQLLRADNLPDLLRYRFYEFDAIHKHYVVLHVPSFAKQTMAEDVR